MRHEPVLVKVTVHQKLRGFSLGPSFPLRNYPVGDIEGHSLVLLGAHPPNLRFGGIAEKLLGTN